MSDAILSMILSIISLFASHMSERSIGRANQLEDKMDDVLAEMRALRRDLEDARYYKRKNDERE